MSKFDFVSARPESATPSALPQNFCNSKAAGNKTRTLKATTARVSTLTAGALVLGLGVAVMAPTQAQAVDGPEAKTVSKDDTWADGASDATNDTTSDPDTDVTTASPDDTVNFTDNVTLTVTNNGTNNDGSGDANTFTIGDVTSTNTGQGTIAVRADADNLAVTINKMGDDAENSVGGLTVTGSNAVDSTAGKNVTTTLVTDSFVDAVTVTSGAGGIAGSSTGTGGAAIAVFDDTLAGTLNITAGAGGDAAGSTAGGNGGAADLVLHKGATGNITLDNGAAGKSTFNDDETLKAAGGDGGTATLSIGDGVGPSSGSGSVVGQTITGSITAAADGEGVVIINNTNANRNGLGSSVTITGDVGASDKAIGSITQTAGWTTYEGSVYAKSYSQSEGTLTVNGNMDVTDFNNEGASSGLLTFSGTTAQTITVVDDDPDDDDGTAGLVFSKPSGSSGSMYVENAAGVTFTTAVTLTGGNLYVGDGGASSATFSDTVTLPSGYVIVGNGATTSTSVFSDNVDLSNGYITVNTGSTATFAGDITVARSHSLNTLFTVDSGATAVINGGTNGVTTFTATNATASSISGKLQLDNTLKLGGEDSDLVLNDGSTLVLGITEGIAIDASDNSTDAVTVSGGTITVVGSNGMQNGTSVIIVNDKSGLKHTDIEPVESSNFADFSVDDDGTNIVLIARSRSTADIAADLGLSETDSERLLAAFNNSTNSSFSNFVGAATDEEQIALLAEQITVQEETLTATAGAISGSANQVAGITVDRLASLRTGDAYGLEADQAAAGFATGDGAMNRNMWGKLFFNTASQNNVDDAAGYDSDTNGFVIGSDTEVGPNRRLGGSLAVSRSDVDGKGGGDAKTDIDGYQLTVYGDLTQSDYFIDWQIGVSMSNVETLTEIDPASTLQSGSNSEYDTLTYLAKVGVGMPLNISAGDMGEGARFTPYGSLGFQRITSDSYDLIFPDDPGLNQNVSPDDVDELTGSLGGRYTVAIETEGGATLSPQVRGALNYDFIGNTAEATSTYNDGTELTVKGVEAEKFGASLGAGINYVSDATTLGFDIDSTLKDGYASYTGALNFRLQF